MYRKNYKRGSNKSAITMINTTVGKRYLAVTATKSNTYKTLKGAKSFMSKSNYREV